MRCAFCGFDPAGPFARGRKLADRGGRMFCASGDCEALEAARARVPPFGAAVDVNEIDGVWRYSMADETARKVGEVKDADPAAVIRYHLEMGSVIPRDVAWNAAHLIDCMRKLLSVKPPLEEMLGNEVLGQLVTQMRWAFHKHPGRDGRFEALLAEIKELAAELDAERADLPHRRRAEALDVAIVALRIALDGDADFDAPEAKVT